MKLSNRFKLIIATVFFLLMIVMFYSLFQIFNSREIDNDRILETYSSS